MKEFKIVEVEWIDAQSGFSSPHTLEELESEGLIKTYSVGYLLKKDKEKITLGFMLFGEEGYFKHWQIIPIGMVKKITEFFPKDTKKRAKKKIRK